MYTLEIVILYILLLVVLLKHFAKYFLLNWKLLCVIYSIDNWEPLTILKQWNYMVICVSEKNSTGWNMEIVLDLREIVEIQNL